MDQVKIGSFLKQLRKEKGETQEQLAEKLSVSSRTVSRWENGNNMPDLDVLVILADYYEVDIKEILDGKRKGENMDSETKETLLKVSEYNDCKEKYLLKKVVSIVICGIIAWIVSLVVTIHFMDEVIGANIILLETLVFIVLYSVLMLVIKANRTVRGYTNSLVGMFVAVAISNILLLAVFFGNGSYHNYGIIGAYYSVAINFFVYLLSGVSFTVINNKNYKR